MTDRKLAKAVPLASLTEPQRRLVTALIEAAKAAAAKGTSDGSR